MPRERACRNCRSLVAGNKCDNCGSTNLTSSYSGLLILISPGNSEIAKLLGIERPGRYALKIE
ncbi:MAG: transcription elongation factor subunit Spt4 [Candidatus Caldarchaeales archaeon]|nr:transcription elongation factor subunit Spt4 [Candidatus Caldarchaeales archaeon]MDT7915557.1 transcription elongation factor subunit Spt4 [Candidatus Caldarchaeales archaeon]